MVNAFTSKLNLSVFNNTTFKDVVTFPVGAFKDNKGFSIPPGQEPFTTNSAAGVDFSGKFPQPNDAIEGADPNSSKPPEPSTRPYIWKKAP
jgi:hypothetical protein